MTQQLPLADTQTPATPGATFEPADAAFSNEVVDVTTGPGAGNAGETPHARFTEVDLNRVRQQEKDKLYPQINELKNELSSLRQDRDERDRAYQAQVAAEEDARRRKAEEEMDVRTLLQSKEQEWQTRLDNERSERERAFALLDQERKLAEVERYRLQRVEQERDNILPELIDLISGSSADEVERSVAGLRERSSRILASAQGALAPNRVTAQGARVTMPPAGPMDDNMANRTFSPEEIRNMSTAEYAKHRASLVGKSGEGQGLFG